MKARLVFLLAFVYSLSGWGQTQPGERCGSRIDYEKLRKYNPSLYNYLKEIDRKAAEYSQRKQNGQAGTQSIPNTATIVTIPVVVHVIHNGEAVGTGRNISDAQIQSQIDVLNEDFRRLNADRTNTLAEFVGVAADAGIQFRLACLDPNGNPTNGIRRVQGGQADYDVVQNPDGTVNEAATGIKANDAAWNRDQYLNIWTASMNNDILGYAPFPGAAANVDGVVIQFNAFGRIGNLQANFDRGRTATHEVGHWLSLFHIWGDDDGACTGTDNVADTPNQADSYTNQCPSGQRFSCGTSNMYQNYMDYTNDACMNLFTAGQRDRMKALFLAGNARAGFISWSDISGSFYVCDNNTYTYSVNSSGTAFNWSVSGNLTITSGQGTSQITVARVFDGPATISVTSQGLCSSRSVTAGPPRFDGFLVNGQPFQNGYFCAGSSQYIQAQPSNVDNSYNWYISSGNTSNGYLSPSGSTATFTSYTSECYGISLQVTNGCGTTQTGLTLCAQNCFARYAVFPNPAQDYVTIEFDKVDSSDVLPDKIELLSEGSTKPVKMVDVQEVFSRKTFTKGNQIEIDVRELPRGTYYLHILNSRRKDKEVDALRILLE